jgi:hypothetical protein
MDDINIFSLYPLNGNLQVYPTHIYPGPAAASTQQHNDSRRLPCYCTLQITIAEARGQMLSFQLYPSSPPHSSRWTGLLGEYRICFGLGQPWCCDGWIDATGQMYISIYHPL